MRRITSPEQWLNYLPLVFNAGLLALFAYGYGAELEFGIVTLERVGIYDVTIPGWVAVAAFFASTVVTGIVALPVWARGIGMLPGIVYSLLLPPLFTTTDLTYASILAAWYSLFGAVFLIITIALLARLRRVELLQQEASSHWREVENNVSQFIKNSNRLLENAGAEPVDVMASDLIRPSLTTGDDNATDAP